MNNGFKKAKNGPVRLKESVQSRLDKMQTRLEFNNVHDGTTFQQTEV